MTLTYKPQSRDRLYYDEFRYCIAFYLPHSGRSRTMSLQKIREAVQFANLMSWVKHKVAPEQEQNLLKVVDVIRQYPRNTYKRIVYSSWQYVYTNDEYLIQQLAELDFLTQVKTTEAVVTLPRDVVLLKNSRYQFRSYFSSRWFHKEEVAAIKNFLVSRGRQFRTTPAVRARLNGDYFYPNDWMFVDHHDEKDVFLLNLVVSRCIRKTLPIQTTK